MILFGQKNAGKTYLGNRLARCSGFRLFDTDRVLLEKHPEASSIADLYQKLGEETFRREESRLIASLPPYPLIALGGGTLLHKKNRDHLKTLAPMVQIDPPLATLLARGGPSFLPPEKWEDFFQQRALFFKWLRAPRIDPTEEKGLDKLLVFLGK